MKKLKIIISIYTKITNDNIYIWKKKMPFFDIDKIINFENF